MPHRAMVLLAMSIITLNGRLMPQSRSWQLNWSGSGRQRRFLDGGRPIGGLEKLARYDLRSERPCQVRAYFWRWWLVNFTLVGVSMSQKSSVTQIANLVQ